MYPKKCVYHGSHFLLQGDELMHFSITDKRNGRKHSNGNKWSHACAMPCYWPWSESHNILGRQLHHLSGKRVCFASLSCFFSVVFVLAMERRSTGDLEQCVFARGPQHPSLTPLFPVARIFLSFTGSHWINSKPACNLYSKEWFIFCLQLESKKEAAPGKANGN